MIYEILILLVLVLFNGVFAMAEMAIVTARQSRLQAKADAGSRAARSALQLARDPAQFLSTVQIGITFVGIVAGVYGGATIAADLERLIRTAAPGLSENADSISYAAVVLVITYLSLIFGELVPKQLALAFPEAISTTVTPLLRLMLLICRPFVSVLEGSSKIVIKLMGIRIPGGRTVTEEDVRSIVRQGAEQGAIEGDEGAIVSRTLRLGDRPVQSIMTPRRDMVWIDIAAAPEDVWTRVLSAPHSYFPACEGTVDNLQGILALKDLAVWRSSAPESPVIAKVRQACVLPPKLSILEALQAFRREKQHCAVLVDEHGTIEGFITTHDLLEALVGELSDNPKEEPTVLLRPDGTMLVDGGLDIDDLADRLGLPHGALAGDGSFRSVGGLVMWALDGIPVEGDTVIIAGYRFEVIDMDRCRVDKVLVRREPSNEAVP